MGSNMQAHTEMFFVAFCVAFFTLAKSQNCLKASINDTIQKTGLLESYVTGHTMKLKCVTGYVGLPKLECKDGEWVNIGRECKKKACGHPGDTPNGHFSLVREKTFVYGAVVEYTCNTGYIMGSRINYRNCRTQGWDNAVPDCEVVKCPVIRHFGDLIVSGNTEEASYGDVIHFECPSNKMLFGPDNVHCNENGQWSDATPICKEIQCLPPNIPHGSTIPSIVYNNNDILKYSCDEGFVNRPGTPKCSKDGWTIQPGCEEITCENPSGLHLKNPQPIDSPYKFNIQISYHCEDGYRSKDGLIKCTETGWKPTPQCIDITCQKPQIANGNVRSQGYYLVNRFVTVECDNGYEPKSFKMKCNLKGEWDILEECKLKKAACPEILLPNTLVLVQNPDVFYYSCDLDYKAFDGKWWGEVKCIERQWSHVPLCIHKDQCGVILNVNEKHNQTKKVYEHEESAEFMCESESYYFKCNKGTWFKHACKERCGLPPSVENAIITSHGQHKVKYDCRENYEMKGNALINCNKSQWEPQPMCELKKTCEEISVPNGLVRGISERFYYSCKAGYKSFDGKWWGEVTCIDGQWSRAPLCILEDQCGEIPNVNEKSSQTKKAYKHEEVSEFTCESEPYYFKCNNGAWKKQVCEDGCDTPPSVENSVVTSHSRHNVTYECRENHEMKGNASISCRKSQWEPQPACQPSEKQHICSKPKPAEGAMSMPLGSVQKEFYEEGDTDTETIK